jgi:hypothetical protein
MRHCKTQDCGCAVNELTCPADAEHIDAPRVLLAAVSAFTTTLYDY